MTRDQMLAHLRATNAVAREAAAHGHHPFRCALVGPDDCILMRQGNIDVVRHPETELCIETGRLITAAKQQLEHGEFEAMVEKPPHWGTLYELTKLTDDEFQQKLSAGGIHS